MLPALIVAALLPAQAPGTTQVPSTRAADTIDFVALGHAASGARLLGTPGLADAAQYALRVTSGAARGPLVDGMPTYVLASSVNVEALVSPELMVRGMVSARPVLGAPLTAGRQELALGVQYAPSALSSKAFGVSLRLDAAHRPDAAAQSADLGSSVGSGGLILGGIVGPIGWGLEANARMVTTSGSFSPDTTGLVLGAGVDAPLLGSSRLILEGQGWNDEGMRGIALLGVLVPLSIDLDLHVAASVSGPRNERPVYGALLALSGKLGEVDIDRDGLQDREDACPRQTGEDAYVGCPFIDDDKDGVWDAVDACLNEPGTESQSGCPQTDI